MTFSIKTFLYFVLLILIGVVVGGIFWLNNLFNANTKQNLSDYHLQKIQYDDDSISASEPSAIDKWIQVGKLNQYGDPKTTIYKIDPLYIPQTGKYINRYIYLISKFPTKPWKSYE